jgi:Ni/Co efflux regulator RcnB
MKTPFAVIAAVLAVSMGAAQAQGAASAPGMGGMHGWHMSRDNTPGWSMMSRAERKEHHDKMMAMTDHAACVAYMEQHHAKMAERAKERGRTLPAQPRRDACASLKK